jgi:hypothetical protein
MADTVFVDNSVPLIVAAWLNDINVAVYRALGSTGGAGGTPPATASSVLANLGTNASGASQSVFLGALAGNLTAPLVLAAAAVPTPASDNTTKVATTSFVQSAVAAGVKGILAGATTITVGTTLTSANVGQEITINGAVIATLPLANTCPIGNLIWSRSINVGGSVAAQGTDVLVVGGMTSAAAGAFGLGVGDWAIWMSNGVGSWTAIAVSKAASTNTLLSGSGTYNVPFGAKLVEVRAAGGGGGGGGTGTSGATAGGTGGSTTFGTFTASGGVGGLVGTGTVTGIGGAGGGTSGSPTVGLVGAQGGAGSTLNSFASATGTGGNGGTNPFGGMGVGGTASVAGANAATNTGAGGGASGGNTSTFPGGGGGAGGYMEIVIPGPATSYSYGVGAAGAIGAAGTSGGNGWLGGSGIIIVKVSF